MSKQEEIKMKRKIGLGILVLTLCISSFSLAFADINYDEWNSQSVYPKDVVNTKYFTSVKALTDKKVITGDTTGLYYPEKSITRAEFSVMMAKATYNVSDLTATDVIGCLCHHDGKFRSGNAFFRVIKPCCITGNNFLIC